MVRLWTILNSVSGSVCFNTNFNTSTLSKRPSSYCLIHFGGSSGEAWGQKTTFDGRGPLMEDDLRLKTTFDGRWTLMEDDLQWKTTFDGRRPSLKDDLWCVLVLFSLPELLTIRSCFLFPHYYQWYLGVVGRGKRDSRRLSSVEIDKWNWALQKKL